MTKLFGVGQKAASGGIQGDVLATDNNTVGMGDAGIKSAIQGSNVLHSFPTRRSSDLFLREARERLESAGVADEMARVLNEQDRKSTRLNSSYPSSSYAVFCLKKKND